MGPKPFDLAAALTSWSTSAPGQPPTPEFKGKPKRKDDPTAEAWLDLVEQGCTARRVPKAHWPDVAKHFMGKKPRGRVAEVEKVMHALHGEQWVWTWKNFRVAVLNMGWNIDEQKTREVKVERKATGLWRIVAGNKGDSSPSNTSPGPAQKTESKIVPPSRKSSLADTKPNQPSPSPPSRKSTLLRKEKEKEAEKPAEKDESTKPKEPKAPKPPAPPRSSSLFSLPAFPGIPGLRRTPAQAEPQTMLAKVTAQVPLWLLATTEALATLANDNPDVLTAVATVLVAVGTVSGGGSAAVAAIGEAAIVVGRAIKSAHDRVHGSGAQGR
ncbi:hypothetical protein GSI_11986 [Ganoderma sinense ZZ0214-1]|uniref:Uncharacterized protein n=1 Tax=Ganoderma sinense ZZ0214-1 TaxID=1077348 RepID=A0A2G8RXI7_9APHY|nr:hypothetical protein GSI_11986 [Ganoderma sinense ZZ0214-1]